MATSKAPKAPPTEPEPTPSPSPPHGNRFFSWMRGLGIQRQPGWIGGVSAGIGLRLGIDPIIVRGIIVVIAVLGGPAVLLYAAAWLLLPDSNDRIHAEDLGRGVFNPALLGIGVMALLSLLPLSQGFWYLGSVYWAEPSWAAAFGRVLWTALVLAAIVVFVIWIARRASNNPIVTPATTDDRPETIPTPFAPDDGNSTGAGSPSEAESVSSSLASNSDPAALIAPAPPPVPTAGASAVELEEWKRQQDEWKQHNAEWKAQRVATEREVREQRAAESRARSLASSAEYAERLRVKRLANPRINAATAFSVLGAAMVGGGIAALVASGTPELAGYELTVAFAVAGIVLGVAIVLAGLLRRRSGVLGFFAVLVVLALLVSAAVPRDRILLGPGGNIDSSHSARYAQPVGGLYLYGLHDNTVSDIWQGAGSFNLTVRAGEGVRVEVRSRSGNVTLLALNAAQEYKISDATRSIRTVGDEWVWSAVIGVDSPSIPTLRLWQGVGQIYFYDENIENPTEKETAP